MNKKLKAALFPGATLAQKAIERRNGPERQVAKQEKAEKNAAVKQAKDVEKAAARQEEEAKKEALYAKYAPGLLGAIRLYKDGTIESRFGNGSIVGATAKVDQSGSQRILRDTRQTYLTIEGPQVSIAVTVQVNNRLGVSNARKFAARVNQLAKQLSASEPVAVTTIAGNDVLDQIRKLAELRDQGIISADDFEAKKAELLGRL